MRHGIRGVTTLIVLILFVSLPEFSRAQETKTVMTLEECIQLALQSNFNLRNSFYMKKAADFDVLKSYRGILPQVSVSVGRGEIETGPSEYLSNEPVGIDPETGNVIYEQRTRKIEKQTRSSSSAGLTVSQTVFDGGIWWNQIRKARTDREASEYQYENDRNQVIFQVQQAYFDLIKQKKLLDVYEVAIERSRAQLERSQKMYELGATAQVDVYRAKVNLGNDRINYLNQKNIFEEAKKKLNLLMGRDPLTPIDVQPEFRIPGELPELEELFKTAWQHHPLLKKDLLSLQSSALSVKMAKGLNFPRISIYLNYDRFHESAIKVFSDYDQNYQIRYGINLSLNLFNGFSDYADIQKAELNRKMVREQIEEYKRSLKSEIHKTYQNYLSTLEMIKINEENLQAAKEEYRLAQERYNIGAGTQLEVREAQVNLTRAEETLVSTEYNAQLLLAQLDNQLGLSFTKVKEKLQK
ncbi:TolC family protein [Caldithrix abyssi]